MKDIIIIEESFQNAKNLNNFLCNRKINSKLQKINDLKKINFPKSVLIGSEGLETMVGGKNNLFKFSRSIGSTKIIILKDTES